MLRKRTAFCLAALVNLVGAWEWHLEGLGLGASAISCAVAGLFLYVGLRPRRLPPLPAVGSTPKQKAEYNLQRIALLVGAEETPGGWQLRAGGETFTVESGTIRCRGKGSTCYHTGSYSMPEEERMANALLFLNKYPQAWAFWREHHGVRWVPLASTVGTRMEAGMTTVTMA